MISFTPATLAGKIVIRIELGYTALPPGTYAPTRSKGLVIRPAKVKVGIYNKE